MKRALVVFLVVILLAVGVSLMVPGVRRGLIRLTTVSGILQVRGVHPQVLYVFVNDSLAVDPDQTPPAFAPPSDLNGTLRFNATIFDQNANCAGTGAQVWFYICSNETPITNCNPTTAYATLTTTSAYAQYDCADCPSCCCNYSVTWDQFPYFKRCGYWHVNVTARDTTSLYNTTTKRWRDAMRLSLYYPWVSQGNAGNTIDLGIVNTGQWNNDTGTNYTKNGGNVNITLNWNATDFTGTEAAAGWSIPIDPCSAVPGCTDGAHSTFGIDDAPGWPPCGWINETPTVQLTYPTYGVRRCDNYLCTSPPQAKYYIYWHLFIESGKMSGPYNNTIQVDFSSTEECD